MAAISSRGLRGLYLITPESHDTDELCLRVDAGLQGGATLVQYRNKSGDGQLRRAQAHALLVVCRRYGVPLLINDDVALARTIGADGVHVGEFDAGVADARHALGDDAIVGASCYDDASRARRARDAGASYVAFGAFHPSPTKPNARRASPDLLREASDLGIPRVAIGGITAENAPPLIAAGADLLAVITAVFDASDVRVAARRISDLFPESA